MIIPRPGAPAFQRAILFVILANVGVLALLAVTGILGLWNTGGTQPAQLVVSASPTATLGLMPMGNAHIPTSNACILCHGAGGEVKTVPSILHPVEGWRRCLTCHTDTNLGRLAPGHEGIAESECLNCHKTAQTGPAITQPHAALHDQNCLDCHGTVAHLPTTMASSKEGDCVLCHKPTSLPPPSYPHPENARLTCRTCHRSAEAGALPIDHALRTDSTCLLCHDIKVVGESPAASGPTLDPSGLLLPLPGP
jgi:hypothetical protein